jgi:hypothetical protein
MHTTDIHMAIATGMHMTMDTVIMTMAMAMHMTIITLMILTVSTSIVML